MFEWKQDIKMQKQYKPNEKDNTRWLWENQTYAH